MPSFHHSTTHGTHGPYPLANLGKMPIRTNPLASGLCGCHWAVGTKNIGTCVRLMTLPTVQTRKSNIYFFKAFCQTAYFQSNVYAIGYNDFDLFREERDPEMKAKLMLRHI
jgi:hypothetical protein